MDFVLLCLVSDQFWIQRGGIERGETASVSWRWGAAGSSTPSAASAVLLGCSPWLTHGLTRLMCCCAWPPRHHAWTHTCSNYPTLMFWAIKKKRIRSKNRESERKKIKLPSHLKPSLVPRSYLSDANSFIPPPPSIRSKLLSLRLLHPIGRGWDLGRVGRQGRRRVSLNGNGCRRRCLHGTR